MATGSETVVFHITKAGMTLANRISALYPGALSVRFAPESVKEHWGKGGRLIFVMAAAIVVRTIAPLLQGKLTDPAVVVLDEKGENVVSLLSGHAGGANALTREIASALGCNAVITTASDVNSLPAIDLWAEEQGLVIEDSTLLPKAGTRLVNRKKLYVFSETPLDLPPQFVLTAEPEEADILVSYKKNRREGLKVGALVMRPRNLFLGVGCNRGAAAMEIEDAAQAVLDENDLSPVSLGGIATIDIKGSEPGLVGFAEQHNLRLLTYSARELNGVGGVTQSVAARKATGAQAVAEPSAILGSEWGELIVRKQKRGNVTIAVARRVTGMPDEAGRLRTVQDARVPSGKGAIYIVGTGPGSLDHLTPRARAVIRDSDTVVGYGPYMDLIGEIVRDKDCVTTGMTREIDRCRRAIEIAAGGKKVSVVSGGDPGVYAMAGLVLELLRKEGESSMEVPEVQIIPGISALNACAALLGAPLMHDFASISLSDRLTPWTTIEERLDAAGRADFVIVLYNPRSRGRAGHLHRAREIIMKYRVSSTPVGIVKAATRADETVTITDLANIPFEKVDMQTTVIIGNSKTVVWNNLMITPRGYEGKGI